MRSDITRERRCEIVAQRKPLLVIVLKREHPLIRTVLIGEKFAQRVGIFDHRRLNRIEAIALVDLSNALDHAPRRCDLGSCAVVEAARKTRLELVGFVGFVGHYRRELMTRR